MCCLYGAVNYSGKTLDGMNKLINLLAQEATVRGTDATGISYNLDNRLIIYKKPLSAYEMEFKHLEDTACVMGHTRHTTQGGAQHNPNNHPFMGWLPNNKFALAHNGVLFNDRSLQKQYGFDNTKIQTDSYIAVQLLEHFGELNFQNIRTMAEMLNGSFTFSIMDKHNTLWLVKGDNPLHIIHLPKRKLYIYASTDDILFRALIDSPFFKDISKGEFEYVPFNYEEILQISPKGKIKREKFTIKDYSYYYYGRSARWDDYDWNDGYVTYPNGNATVITTGVNDYDTVQNDPGVTVDDDALTDFEKRYLEQIKQTAKYLGIDADEIDTYRAEGWTLDEIADLLYMDRSDVK